MPKILDKVQHNIDALRHQVFRVETKESYGDVSDERMKEAARKFLIPFIRARGYLPQNPVAARNEISAALLEWETNKGYMSPESYEYIKAMLLDIDSLLEKGQVVYAILKMQAVWNFMMRKAFGPPVKLPYIASPFPEGVPGENLIVYRGQSDITHEDVMRDGIKPTQPGIPVYTTIEFREAVRFAWSHSTREGGNPIVYRLSVPINLFTGQVIYRPGPTGFLMSGSIPRQYITDWTIIPQNLEEVWKLEDRYEAEENVRKSETLRLIEKVPKVTFYQLPEGLPEPF